MSIRRYARTNCSFANSCLCFEFPPSLPVAVLADADPTCVFSIKEVMLLKSPGSVGKNRGNHKSSVRKAGLRAFDGQALTKPGFRPAFLSAGSHSDSGPEKYR